MLADSSWASSGTRPTSGARSSSSSSSPSSPSWANWEYNVSTVHNANCINGSCKALSWILTIWFFGSFAIFFLARVRGRSEGKGKRRGKEKGKGCRCWEETLAMGSAWA